MEFLFSNFGDTQLSQMLNPGDSILHVAPSDTLRLPQPGADQVFALILSDGHNEPEILWCNGNPRTGVLSVLRGQEGTPASFWNVGTPVIHTHTAASLEWFVTGGQTVWKAELQAAIDALTARVQAVEAKDTEQDTDLTTALTTLTSSIEQNSATINENWLATTDFFYASSSVTTTLSAAVASNHSDLILLESTVASNETTQATLNATLTTNTNNAASKAQLALDTANTTDSALATYKTSVSARFGSNESRITNAETAITNNYSTQATAISSLSASYGGLSSTVTTQGTAIAGINGALSASWSVVLGVNGSIAALQIINNPAAQQNYVMLNVDNFYIQSSSVPTYTNIFSYNAISGWFEVQNIHVHGDLVVDGTIINSKISNSAIDTHNVIVNSLSDASNLVLTPNVGIPHFGASGSGQTAIIVTFYYGSTFGGRAKLSYQVTLSNNSGPDEAAFSEDFYVNGALIRAYVKKLPSAFPDVHVVTFNVDLVPGTNQFDVYAGVNSATLPGVNVTFVQADLDVDEYKTES